MNVQVLIATMNRQDHALLDQMNIQTDAIVGNQCDRNEIERFQYRGRIVEWLSFSERGVGLNRNNTLMRATGDILLFADDDVVYLDGYEKTIQQFYAAHPDADVVIFNFRKRRNGGEFRNIVKKPAAWAGKASPASEPTASRPEGIPCFLPMFFSTCNLEGGHGTAAERTRSFFRTVSGIS